MIELKKQTRWLFIAFLFDSLAYAGPSALVTPAILKSVKDEREIYTSAKLTDEKSDDKNQKLKLQHYRLVTVMQASASVDQVKRVLEDYAQYEKLIPYVSKSEFNAKEHTLKIEGGIWGFRMSSVLKFDPPEDLRQKFVVIAGHFQGMVGTLSYESAAERGSLVSLEEDSVGTHFPPRFIIEEGAKIIFSFAGKKMRARIEEQSKNAGAKPNDPEVPEPHRNF